MFLCRYFLIIKIRIFGPMTSEKRKFRAASFEFVYIQAKPRRFGYGFLFDYASYISMIPHIQSILLDIVRTVSRHLANGHLANGHLANICRGDI